MAVNGFCARLVAYAPGSDERLGFLTQPLSWQVSFVSSTDTAMTLDYSQLAQGGEILDRPIGAGLDVALEVSGRGGKWVEPASARFWLKSFSADVEDPQKVRKYVFGSYSTQLAFVNVMDHSGSFTTDKRYYNQATPGTVMADLLSDAHRRGVLEHVSFDFTAQCDSLGRPWFAPPLSGVAFEVGGTVAQVLAALSEGGYCAWQMQGRTLRLFNPDQDIPTRPTETMPWLTNHRDITSGTATATVENLVTKGNIRGTGDIAFTLDNPTAPTPWGPFERHYKIEGVGNEGTVRAMAQAELDKAANPATEHTKTLVLPSKHLPLIDYQPGDWVRAELTPGQHELAKVRQITLTYSSSGLSGNLVLGSRFLESQVAHDRILSRLTGGATVAGNGTSAGLDLTPDPGQPIRLTVSSTAFIDEFGRARATATLRWNLLIDQGGDRQYIVEGKNFTAGEEDAPWQPMGLYVAPQAEIPSLPARSQWQFRVAGFSGTRTSDWCLSERVTLAAQDGAGSLPPIPAAITTARSTVLFTWGGKVSGAAGVEVGVPADFARLECALTVTPEAPGEDAVVSPLMLPGGQVAIVAAMGSKVYGWTRLVDTSGRVTAWVPAQPESVVVRGISGPDIEAGSVSANQIDAGGITAAIGTFVQASVGQISGQAASFVKSVVSNLSANTAVLNTLWADIIKGRYISAEQITGDVVRASQLYVGGVKVNPECLRGQGTINNPVSYGSSSLSSSSLECGQSEMTSTEIRTGSVKINSWGNGFIPRCDASRFAATELTLGTLNGDSISGRNSFIYQWSGARFNGALDVDGAFSAGQVTTSGWVRAGKLVETSTAASKEFTEPVRDLTALLDVVPVAYRGKAGMDEWRTQFGEAGPSRPLRALPERQAGWVAEDLEEAGLGILVGHDPETGEPIGVEYSRVSVALWQVARAQRDQISDLDARLTNLQKVLAKEGR